MRKLLICFVFVSLFYLPAAAYVSEAGDYGSYPKITNLEQVILRRSYENEDINTRLSRLEMKTFRKTFEGSDLSWRTDNLLSANSGKIYNISSQELSRVEKQAFGKAFPKDTIENRLSRLEVNLLGAAQSGAPDKRLQTVLTALNSYTNNDVYANSGNYSYYPQSFDSNPINVNKTGFWNGVKNFFNNAGYMTGCTPPITPYGYNMPYGFSPNPYYSGYNTPYMHAYPAGENKYYRNNYGYSNINRSIGSGAGVRILD